MKNRYKYSRESQGFKTPKERQRYVAALKIPGESIETTLPDRERNFSGPDMERQTAEIIKIGEEKPVDTITKKNQTYKSWGTKIQESLPGFAIAAASTIFLGVVGVCVTTVWSQQEKITKTAADIESLNKNIDDLKSKYSNIDKNNFDISLLRTEVYKDIEFIGQRLDKIETKIGF